MFEQFIGTKPVEQRLRFDVDALERYVADHVDGLKGPFAVEQFRGGQSNPTYRISAADGRHFVSWDLSLDQALSRIEKERSALGREPNIGEVAWFTSAQESPNQLLQRP